MIQQRTGPMNETMKYACGKWMIRQPISALFYIKFFHSSLQQNKAHLHWCMLVQTDFVHLSDLTIGPKFWGQKNICYHIKCTVDIKLHFCITLTHWLSPYTAQTKSCDCNCQCFIQNLLITCHMPCCWGVELSTKWAMTHFPYHANTIHNFRILCWQL
jgi:hypothetical protein